LASENENNMLKWHVAESTFGPFDWYRLGPVPLELNPSWLATQVDRADKGLKIFLLGEQSCPTGYAPFLIHHSELAYCLGESAVFRIPVVRYAMKGEPLCGNATMLPELFKLLKEMVGKADVVFFEGIEKNSPLSRLLTLSKSTIKHCFHVVPYGPTYTRRLIELAPGDQFEDYLSRLGRKTREDIRRTLRNFRIKANGVVTLARYTRPEQAQELAALLAQISLKTYQHHLLGLGLENTPEYVGYLRVMALNGWLRAYVLKIDDTPVAFGLGYQDSNIYYGHHIGYDPEIAKLQPGIYLHAEVMADLLQDGIFHFDFMPGDSLYKQRMSNKSREERHYYLIPRGWPGTAYAVMLITINFLSEMAGRWLEKTGLKERIKRQVRTFAVRRRTKMP
jgi:hypothetical protein